MIVALAGGVGGAKLAQGPYLALPPETLTVVGNTADDMRHLGLRSSPDLDTVLYTLAGMANAATGRGLAGDSPHLRPVEALRRGGLVPPRRSRPRHPPPPHHHAGGRGHADRGDGQPDTRAGCARDDPADVRRAGRDDRGDAERAAQLPGLLRAAASPGSGEREPPRGDRRSDLAGGGRRGARRRGGDHLLPVQSVRQPRADPGRARFQRATRRRPSAARGGQPDQRRARAEGARRSAAGRARAPCSRPSVWRDATRASSMAW